MDVSLIIERNRLTDTLFKKIVQRLYMINLLQLYVNRFY